jgi:N-acetylneuraminic acid mutarotase
VHFYDEEKKEWQAHSDKLPMGPYHNVAQYSAKHRMVLFGGGNGSTKLYAMDADGKIKSDLKEAPSEIGINTALVTSDPVTGAFLVLTKDDKFYSYNPATDAWKELSTEGMPFAMKGSSFDVVATPVASHGVTVFFTAQHSLSK